MAHAYLTGKDIEAAKKSRQITKKEEDELFKALKSKNRNTKTIKKRSD